jgi:hypothetical protein
MPELGLQFLTLSGIPLPGPREWTPAFVEITTPNTIDWGSLAFRINEVEQPLSLRRIDGAVRLVADWPRVGPGRYRLQVTAGAASQSAIVEVLPSKMSMAEFGDMVEQLETRLPLSVALGLQRLGGLAGVALVTARESTLASEIQRLRVAVHGDDRTRGLVAVLRDLHGDPHRSLQTTGLWVHRKDARRPDPNRVLMALRRPNNLSPDGKPIEVFDARVEHSFDVYENRLVRTFVTQVDRRLRRALRATEGDDRRSLREDVTSLTDALGQARRYASFLDDASELSGPPDRLSMVLLRRPPYRAALEAFLRFQRGQSIRIDDPAIEAPLNELPRLYQQWCTLWVIETLLRVAADYGFTLVEERLIGRDGAGLFMRALPDGKPVLTLQHAESGARVRLIPERTYAPGGSGLNSLSFPQRPDIAIELTRSTGEMLIWLLDPKYKLDSEAGASTAVTTNPLKVDIDKMHAYRDAIRDSGGGRAVQYAAIMYPGATRTFPGNIEAISALPQADGGWSGGRLVDVFRRALAVPQTLP